MEVKKINVKTSKKLMDVAHDLLQKHKSLRSYPMHGPKRGVVFVVNNIEFESNRYKRRNGAEVDKQNLKELFTQMGFIWIYWEDQTYKDIMKKLREFTADSNKMLSEVDSCFVIFMSHGVEGRVMSEDTLIITRDNKEFKTSEIINKFSNLSCKLLQDKPKVLIFQACRGPLEDYGAQQHITTSGIQSDYPMDGTCEQLTETIKSAISKKESDVSVAKKLPNKSDMLICYSSSPGYLSYRDEAGSWFIQHFCEIFMNHAHDTHIETLFHMVKSEVIERSSNCNNVIQCPYTGNYFFRPCYLNPGL